MYPRRDLTNKKYGMWTALKLEVDHTAQNKRKWLCVCDCGTKRIVSENNLLNHKSTSCGCRRVESNKQRSIHNASHSSLWQIHKSMKHRCYYMLDKNFKNYGGRGITICDEWLGNAGFVRFMNWALENGFQEGLTIDRIDNDGGYEPSNCRWVTMKEQNLNKRSNAFIEFMGIRKPRSVWADAIGIHSTSLKYRVEKWGIEKALLTDKDGNYIDPAELLKKMREE